MSFIPPRDDFPILSVKVYGKPLTYLDNGASAQKPRVVLDAMEKLATTGYSNVHRGVHFMSATSTEAYETARHRVAKFLNAAHDDEIIFTKGDTQAINLVSYSYLSPRIQPGDEIVISVMEHHSNIVPWHFLRERQGAVLKWADVTDEGVLSADAVEAQFTDKTKFVAITHMSNVLGTISPVKEIIRRAHARGIKVLIDGAQGAVHEKVDVLDWDVDFYTITGHKLYGPTGIGALYAKREHLADMRPFEGGGDMIDTVTKDTVTYAEPPARFEAGTPPILEAHGLGVALEYLSGFDHDAIHAHEADLVAYTQAQIDEMKWIRVIGKAPGKGAIISFEADGIHAHDMATLLDTEGVAVRAGHHCAQPLMERFGMVSTTRASFAFYNTREDADRLIAALHKAREFFG